MLPCGAQGYLDTAEKLRQRCQGTIAGLEVGPDLQLAIATARVSILAAQARSLKDVGSYKQILALLGVEEPTRHLQDSVAQLQRKLQQGKDMRMLGAAR